MATRTRTTWKPRSDGQYDCRVGWKINRRGNRDQHRFRLGTDPKEAKRRDNLLRQMWEKIEQASSSDSTWSDETMELAALVARGVTHLHLPRSSDEDVVAYAQRVRRLRQSFPMLAILPELKYDSAFGVALLDTLDTDYQEDGQSMAQQLEADGKAFGQRLSAAFLPSSHNTGPGLHQAMRDYIDWLESEYSHPETKVTPWGRTQIRQVESLMTHHANVPLAQIQRGQIEDMLRYWRKRPVKQGAKTRVTRKSATHYISALRNFFKWLHSCPSHDWRKPEDFHELKTRVVALDGEQRKQVMPEQIFSLDELVLLYQYGRPLDRLLILLGLNCGFGAAESASLLVDEILLHTPYSGRHREAADFASTANDSFIKRVRKKNGVYGEFLLFEQTVQGIEWALQQRRKHSGLDNKARLLLNGHGEPFDKPTQKGDPNRQIPNRFVRLLGRILKDQHNIPRLSFKMLRKTGGDLVKQFSDGEVAGVFLCHGQPVATDDLSDAYTRRPFVRVFTALREVEKYLAPMFETGGSSPFQS